MSRPRYYDGRRGKRDREGNKEKTIENRSGNVVREVIRGNLRDKDYNTIKEKDP